MEDEERQRLKDRLRSLLQVKGELKKMEKDLATKVQSGAAIAAMHSRPFRVSPPFASNTAPFPLTVTLLCLLFLPFPSFPLPLSPSIPSFLTIHSYP